MADLTVTAANVVFTSGEKKTGIAGETITAGQSIYLKASDSKLWKAQCDGTSAEAEAVGIALHGATANQPLTYAPQGSVINIGATTAKTHYMVAAAAGGVAPIADITTSGHYLTRLGYGTATDGSFKVDIAATGVTV